MIISSWNLGLSQSWASLDERKWLLLSILYKVIISLEFLVVFPSVNIYPWLFSASLNVDAMNPILQLPAVSASGFRGPCSVNSGNGLRPVAALWRHEITKGMILHNYETRCNVVTFQISESVLSLGIFLRNTPICSFYAHMHFYHAGSCCILLHFYLLRCS